MPVSEARPSRADIVPWPEEAAAHYLASGYWENRPLGAYLHAAADAARTRSASSRATCG